MKISTLETQENKSFTTINNEKEIEEDGNQVPIKKKKGGNLREQVQRNFLCIALLFNLFFSLLLLKIPHPPPADFS